MIIAVLVGILFALFVLWLSFTFGWIGSYLVLTQYFKLKAKTSYIIIFCMSLLGFTNFGGSAISEFQGDNMAFLGLALVVSLIINAVFLGLLVFIVRRERDKDNSAFFAKED